MESFFLKYRCPEGFLGEYCQHRDPCEKNRCQNGGTCVTQAMLGKATCRCAPGFTGEDCQYSTSHPCFVSRPCQNGGTCHMLSWDTYECSCQVGFTGNVSDFPVSEVTCVSYFSLLWENTSITATPRSKTLLSVMVLEDGSIVARKAWRPSESWLVSFHSPVQSRAGQKWEETASSQPALIHVLPVVGSPSLNNSVTSPNVLPTEDQVRRCLTLWGIFLLTSGPPTPLYI